MTVSSVHFRGLRVCLVRVCGLNLYAGECRGTVGCSLDERRAKVWHAGGGCPESLELTARIQR